MTPDLFLRTAIVPAFDLLPDEMDSAEARALVLAIALQETGLYRRRQMNDGPARSFAQFEAGELSGIAGVLRHEATHTAAASICRALVVVPTVDGVHVASEYNDMLCAAFARLLLRTSALPLAGPSEPPVAWRLYIDAWRPGAPRPNDWRGNYALAWNAVLQGRQTEHVLKA